MPVKIIEKYLELKDKGFINRALTQLHSLYSYAHTQEDMTWVRNQIKELTVPVKKSQDHNVEYRLLGVVWND